MKKVKFEFGDGNIYDGLTDGSTWNGFANIWVENNVYRQILNNYDHSMYDYKESELFGIEPTEDGLYAFTYGFSNTIIKRDKQMKYKTHNEIKSISVNGTSLQGHINTSYQQLVDKFGEPSCWDDYKCDAEWKLVFDDGLVATIYNWKNGYNYCGEDGTETKNITKWNIGGNTKEVEDRITTIINEPKQNPYLEWSEDSIGDELFELKQWIVEDWLSNREQDSVDEDSQYYKYCQLNDALDTLENGEDK